MNSKEFAHGTERGTERAPEPQRTRKSAGFWNGLALWGKVAVVAFATMDAHAATLNVPGDHVTVQAAIDAAAPGDTIQIAPGTYGESVRWIGKDLILQGAGASVTFINPSAAGLGPIGPCLTTTGLTSASRLEGVTLTGGVDGSFVDEGCECPAPDGTGGGMVNIDSSPTIANCVFARNSRYGDYWQIGIRFGGGMYNLRSHPTVTSCVFSENGSNFGGGMGNIESSPVVSFCRFERNAGAAVFSAASGIRIADCFFTNGGVQIENCVDGASYLRNSIFDGCENGGRPLTTVGSRLTVTGCTFVNNVSIQGSAVRIRQSEVDLNGCLLANNLNPMRDLSRLADAQGGAIYCQSATVRVANCTIAGNQGSGWGAGIRSLASTLSIANSIVWGNRDYFPDGDDNVSVMGGPAVTVTHSNIPSSPAFAGVGNLDQDPMFADPEYGDFRLMGGSPCVNVGDDSAVPAALTTDLAGNARIIGSAVDMGAYEQAGAIRLQGARKLLLLCGSHFEDAGAVAVDANGQALDVSVSGVANPSTPGTYILRYSATDALGVTYRATRTVSVGNVLVDVYSGYITAAGGAPFSNYVGTVLSDGVQFAPGDIFDWHPLGQDRFGAVVRGVLEVAADGTYDLGVRSDDGSMLYIDGLLVVDNGGNHGPRTVSASVSLTQGRHAFTIEFYNSGGASGLNFLLPEGVRYACPTVQCPSDVVVASAPGQCGATVNFPLPTVAGDGLGLTVAPSVAPGSFFPLGATAVVCDLFDAHQNSVGQCRFQVVVTGASTPRVVSCPANLTVQCPISPAFGTPVFEDLCQPNLSVSFVDEALVLSGKEVSKVRRTWTAMNASGATVQCSQVLTVMDEVAPSLTVPADVTVIATSSLGSEATYASAVAVDGCSNVSVSYSRASGAMFPLGSTVVEVVAMDSAGNSVRGSFRVNVVYSWSGLLQPVRADGTTSFKAGSVASLRFRLTGASAGIRNASARLIWERLDGGFTDSGLGGVFRYDTESGQYLCQWSTRGLPAGRYRLRVELGDRVERGVEVRLF